MAEEARFVFEFVDKGTSGPASSKPGTTGAPPPRADFTDAAGKADANNQRATPKPTVTPGAAAAASPTKETGNKAVDAAAAVKDALNATKGAFTAGSAADAAGKAVTAGKAINAAAGAVADALKGARETNAGNFAPSKPPPGADNVLTAEGSSPMGMIAAGSAARAAMPALGGAAARLAGPLAVPLVAGVVTAKMLSWANGKADEIAASGAADFSPDMAAARAMNEVRQTIADMRTARTVGGRVSDIMTVKSEIKADLQSIRDDMVKPLLGPLEGVLLAVKGLTGVASYLSPKISEALEGMLFDPTGIHKELEEMNRNLRRQNTGFLDWFEAQPLPAPPWWKGTIDSGDDVVGVKFKNALPGLQL